MIESLASSVHILSFADLSGKTLAQILQF